MTEPEREKLVADLANYVAMLATHQRERMGGKLLLRAFEALKSIRVLEKMSLEHDNWVINPAWETAKYGIEEANFTSRYAALWLEKERLTSRGTAAIVNNGSDTPDSVDSVPPAGN